MTRREGGAVIGPSGEGAAGSGREAGRLSVIIPLWEEGDGPATLLDVLEESPSVREVLAVEAAGDRSKRLSAARWSKVRFLESQRGRACQMNAGARAATGELLLFLHADSYLEPPALQALCEVLGRPGPIAASFQLRFREQGLGLSLLAWAGRTLSAINPYVLGDQALALRRTDFRNVGGFPEVPILEDWILVRTLRSAGRLEILDVPYRTSGRRFLRAGVFRQLWKNTRILYRYGEGEDLHSLAREYQRPPAASPTRDPHTQPQVVPKESVEPAVRI